MNTENPTTHDASTTAAPAVTGPTAGDRLRVAFFGPFGTFTEQALRTQADLAAGLPHRRPDYGGECHPEQAQSRERSAQPIHTVAPPAAFRWTLQARDNCRRVDVFSSSWPAVWRGVG